ncbi:MAG TPA: methyltransferase domain-containing protein [Chloroflexota bacterium]
MIPRLYRAAAEATTYNQRRRDEWVAGRARTLSPGTSVLDVGAGSGRYRHLFSHCVYRAQDFAEYGAESTTMFERPYEYTRLDYVSDATAIPVPDGSFDAVLCTEVLEHVPEPIAVIREIGRILRPGGRLFLTAPLLSALHMQPYHFYGGFTPHFYDRFLPEAGLRMVTIEPNGRYFRLLAQELARAGGILLARRRYHRWHPLGIVVRYLVILLGPAWFVRLDDEIPIEEFNAGYHVEAIRE